MAAPATEPAYRFPYRWNLADGFPAPGIDAHGHKVFGTFICGGGSSMGYKLAGFDCLGGVEIDKKMATIYKINMDPAHLYVEDIRHFNKREKLPAELFNLDILDGSPPCSSFSMSGNRERDWGKQKQFAEGQAFQQLDDLFFHFIDTTNKLRPKCVVAENVIGLIKGNARSYVRRIREGFQAIGYDVQLFKLNAASMGVPQSRERVFFICRRQDLNWKPIKLAFDEEPIPVQRAIRGLIKKRPEGLCTPPQADLWVRTKPGNSLSSVHPKGHRYNYRRIDPRQPCPTLVASGSNIIMHYNEARGLAPAEHFAVQSFPQDYELNGNKSQYVCGMSVPPVMIAQVAYEIYLQWLS